MSFPFRRMGMLVPPCCLAAVFLGAVSCNSSTQSGAGSPGTNPQRSLGKPFPAGKLTNDRIAFRYAIYFLPEAKTDPLEEFGQLLGNKFPELRRVEAIEERPFGRTVAAKFDADPRSDYPPPDMASLQYFGRGLTPDQAEALQETKGALLLTFAHPIDDVWVALRKATELTHALALSTDGLIWDEETREVFTPEAWKARRIAEWTDTIPDISTQTVMHAYRKDESVRVITLGMAKVGLPDIVVEQTSLSNRRNIGHVINLLAQALAEGAQVTKPGEFDLNFREIKHPAVRDPQVSTLLGEATGIALLTLREGARDDGDPKNRLVEITFERGTGPDASARQEDILTRAFGSEDSISKVRHDEDLKQASERARQQLPALRAAFEKGLAPAENLLVKAPFKTASGGNEWMWVEVTSWRGDEIRGLLQNDPFEVPDLKAGQSVKVSEAEVFDYLRVRSDGTIEGNETGKLIEERSKSQ